MPEPLERTEKATPRRREEARRHGQVVVSPEIAPVAALFTALVMASWGAPILVRRTRTMLAGWLAAVGPTAAQDDPVAPLLWRATGELAAVLGPFFLAIAVVGIGTVIAQVGWHVTPELVAPDPERIGFERGRKRIFSLQGVANLLKAVAKIVLVLAVAQRVLVTFSAGALAASLMPVEAIAALAGAGLQRLGLAVALVLAIVGAADYAWTRWRHEQSLKMSRRELREELKQSEGDPRVRMRLRRAHRVIATRSMLAEVARADVVLANPAQVAVAIRYRPDDMQAPRVIAKGADELGEKIEAAARRAGVPIVERRALARVLFRSVQVGAETPPALYRAMAEIFAYLHSRRGGAAAEAR
ncbi:MAG: EscU/YscU/HrcU family type III secretion system export apparatus switch protein [Candidatus Binatia bacterium]